MRTARITSEPHTLIFQNFDRIPEEKLFSQAAELLNMGGAILSDQIEELPYLTRRCGTLDSIPFELRLDLSDDTELHCEDEQTMQRLQKILG